MKLFTLYFTEIVNLQSSDFDTYKKFSIFQVIFIYAKKISLYLQSLPMKHIKILEIHQAQKLCKESSHRYQYHILIYFKKNCTYVVKADLMPWLFSASRP